MRMMILAMSIFLRGLGDVYYCMTYVLCNNVMAIRDVGHELLVHSRS